jgi:hypothetical protein
LNVDNDALVTELKWLRQRRGATLVKIKKCVNLLEALGNPKSSESARDRLAAAVQRLTDPELLLNAFALGGSHAQTLLDRRIKLGTARSRGPDTIESWEDDLIDELAPLLALGGAGLPPVDYAISAEYTGGHLRSIIEWSADTLSGGEMKELAHNTITKSETFMTTRGYPIEVRGADYLIWRPAGNLTLRTLSMTLQFLDRADPAIVCAVSNQNPLLLSTCAGASPATYVYSDVMSFNGWQYTWHEVDHDTYYGLHWHFQDHSEPEQPGLEES